MDIESLIFPVEVQSRTDIIKVKPLQDLHKGSHSCDIKGFKQFIADPDSLTYYFLNGDMWDAIYFTDKRFMSSGQDKTDKDAPIDEEIDEMADLLSPIKNRIIAIGIGNHETTILKKHHTNMSKRLADKLGVPYMGWSYWIRFQIYRMDSG